MAEIREEFRFKRQPPEAEFFKIEALLLGATYDLVENIQRMRGSTSREEVERRCHAVERDVEQLRSHLRDVSAEVKSLRGSEPLSKQTDLQQAGDHDDGG